MRFIAILTLITFSGSPLFAQETDFNNFQSLVAAGNIPDDFLMAPAFGEKINVSKTGNESKKELKSKKADQIEHDYLINNLLLSGYVLFGDQVTNYLNAIKDEILRKNPTLSKDVRIYTMLSNEAASFSTSDGIVLITTGLIAQAQNEAQLAFQICHEMAHYYEGHALEFIDYDATLMDGSNVWFNFRNENLNLSNFHFSKEDELAADEKAMSYFNNTDYSGSAGLNIFDVLLFSYLPFDDIAFPKDYFNDTYYQLPVVYFLDSVTAITANEEDKSKKNAYPYLFERISNIENALPNEETAAQKTFVVSEITFNNVQKICRFQACELYLMEAAYEDAIYQSYLLGVKYGKGNYLDMVMAKALYGLAIYKNEGVAHNGKRNYKKISGESQQLFYLFDKMPAVEINTIALKYCYELYSKNSDNTFLKSMITDLGESLYLKNNLTADDYFTKLNLDESGIVQQAPADTAIVVGVKKEDVKITKYDKLKLDKSEGKIKAGPANSQYWRNAFASYLDEEKFYSFLVVADTNKLTQEESNEEIKPIYHLGLNKIAVVEPVYVYINERKSFYRDYETEASRKADFTERINSTAAQLDLAITNLNYQDLSNTAVDKYNANAVANRWMNEMLMHKNDDVELLCSVSSTLAIHSEIIQTQHFVWMGVASKIESESYAGEKAFLIVWPGGWFYVIPDLITPNRHAYYCALVVDAATGEGVMEYVNMNRLRETNAPQLSNIYYIFKQINSSKK
jgi:beta-barrel assembly-enhancing protease